jgi:hypothetical protein
MIVATMFRECIDSCAALQQKSLASEAFSKFGTNTGIKYGYRGSNNPLAS